MCFEETIETTFDLKEAIEGEKQMEQYSQDQIIEYLFSANHIYADVRKDHELCMASSICTS